MGRPPHEEEIVVSPKTKPVRPVAVYTRVSEQGRRSDEELLSHDIQRDKVARYLEGRSIPASPEIFEDTDKSGGKISRPAFDRAVAGVLNGTYGGIAVAKLSRFARTTSSALDLIAKIEDAGGTVIILDLNLDTSTAAGRAMLTVFLAFVTLEREQAIEGAKDLAVKKLTEGTSTGGVAPAGYEFEIVGHDTNGKPLRGWITPNADAPVIAEAFALAAAGTTYGKVSDFLNESGVRTGRGNTWSVRATKLLLANEVYLGVRVYGSVRQEGAHVGIVDPAVWRRVQKRLLPVVGAKTRTRGEGHVLGNGLVRCGHCDAPMSKGAATKYQTLRCQGRGGGHAAIIYEKAEDWIVGVAFAHGVGWALERSGGNSEEIAAADAALALAREDLRDVEVLQESVRPAAFLVALSGAQDVLEAAVEARDALFSEPESERWLTALGAREKFEELPVAERRRVLRQIVERVVLAPGKGSPSERLTITFTDGSVHPAPFDPARVPVAV
jgi:DNA invertase Pin-like site-specific DNA recombinase